MTLIGPEFYLCKEVTTGGGFFPLQPLELADTMQLQRRLCRKVWRTLAKIKGQLT